MSPDALQELANEVCRRLHESVRVVVLGNVPQIAACRLMNPAKRTACAQFVGAQHEMAWRE